MLPGEFIGIARGTAAELGEKLALAVENWRHDGGLDRECTLSAVVAFTTDYMRALTIEHFIGAANDPAADMVRSWLLARCDRTGGERVPVSRLYRDFQRWAAEGGLVPFGIKLFVAQLKRLGVEHGLAASTRRAEFRGIALKEDDLFARDAGAATTGGPCDSLLEPAAAGSSE